MRTVYIVKYLERVLSYVEINFGNSYLVKYKM